MIASCWQQCHVLCLMEMPTWRIIDMMRLDLNGRWQMKRANEDTWLDAVVPGSVFQDLLREGLIADPHYRDNEVLAHQIMNDEYVYTTTFHVGPGLLECDRVSLVFEG